MVAQLLDEAIAAGLTVQVEAGKLIVRGPKSADPDLVRRLLASKADLLPLLTPPARQQALEMIAVNAVAVARLVEQAGPSADPVRVKIVTVNGPAVLAGYLEDWDTEIARGYDPLELVRLMCVDQVKRARQLRKENGS
jgi:hypothetical protein